jgi:hypothetical protein
MSAAAVLNDCFGAAALALTGQLLKFVYAGRH